MGGGRPRAATAGPTRPDLPLNRQCWLAAPTPLLVSPLEGGRDELGKRWAVSGYWAVTVSANWRITFRFDGADVYDVDLVDYH